MKSNPTFQTLRTMKATVAISFALYGVVVLVAVAMSLGALHVGEH